MSSTKKLPLVQPRKPLRHHLRAKGSSRIGWGALSLSALALIWLYRPYHFFRDEASYVNPSPLAHCPQVEPLFPTKKTVALLHMDDYLDTAKFRNETIARMAGAIQIPSQSYDDMGSVGEDPRWDTMYDIAAYLEKAFPLIHSKLKLEKVNTHGLLYTWQGSDASLKPTVLMAHQDVVPVAESTVGQWTYPPFSGTYDGKFIWGRGASDCKNTLIGVMESVELLLDAGYAPKRTLILSFGFDEESSGRNGAGRLAQVLTERYGKNGAALIVDEGAGVQSTWGTTFATPGVAEKGYIDVNVVVRMPGGHSSIPPTHNGIGVMSELIVLVENNLYEPHFDDANPFLSMLQCGAAHSPDFPDDWKKLLPNKNKKDKLAFEVAKSGDATKYLFTTSVAVDIIGGGVKVNALPERTTATINHRVNVGSHPDAVRNKLTKLASVVAEKYNLTLHAFTDEPEIPSSITLLDGHSIEPAPVTPTTITNHSVTPYSVLSGTTRALYGEGIVMAPGIMTGNTDTRFYWNLTSHIFRYVPGWDPDQDGGLENIHTVDEKVSVVSHIKNVKWFSLFIRNMDEADLA